MKLKNEALQKLYDKLASDTFTFNASVEEQLIIDEIFKECDEELSDSITFAQIKDLRDRCDIFEKSNGTLLGANLDLATKKSQLEKDLDNAKKNVEYFRHSRDDWRSRAKHAEDENTRLKESLDIWKNSNEALLSCNVEEISKKEKLEKELERTRKDYDELFEENKKLKARADCLREEVKWYRNHYKEQSAKIGELKSRLNSMYNVKYGEYVRSRDTGYKNGQTDLWDKLQNVNDAKPFELAACFPDVSCMDDILSWDLEDFLDAYKNWQEKKEQERIKHMRDYLVRFCMGRRCDGCPLHTDGFICGRGKGFCDMTYEELKKHYEKVRDCGRCPFKRKDD